MKIKQLGFTIVELLVTIVVIGILTSLVTVAYNGAQDRARDTIRQNDIDAITKALEEYYQDHGEYPRGGGSTSINSLWSTTADSSWQNLKTALADYISVLPEDPINTQNFSLTNATNPDGRGYAYYSNFNVNYCGAEFSQMYILIYRLDSAPRKLEHFGDCPTRTLSYEEVANNSQYRVVRR